MKAIINILKVIKEHSHLLPEKLRTRAVEKNLDQLRLRSKNILLEIKHKSFTNAPALYEELGKALKKIGKVISIMVATLSFSTSIAAEPISSDDLTITYQSPFINQNLIKPLDELLTKK